METLSTVSVSIINPWMPNLSKNAPALFLREEGQKVGSSSSDMSKVFRRADIQKG